MCILLAAASAAACAPAPPSAPAPPGASGYYTSAFPTTDMSEQLSRVFESVKQIQVTTVYEVYSFATEDAPTRMDLAREDVTRRATRTETVSQIRRASAVLISQSANDLLFLTAAHAVFRPDTVFQYVGPAQQTETNLDRPIRSLSIKNRQTNWVLDLPNARTFEVLAWDEDADVALIGFHPLSADLLMRARPVPVRARPMPARVGSPRELAAGSFVYILGYPGGHRMVSGGIATPTEDDQDSFVVDGNWNQGVSGGAILAIRGDDRTLEWVGMARAASAIAEERVVPPPSAAGEYDPALPYEGPIFLEETLRIQYGITLSVSMTTIREFVDLSRRPLLRLGYLVPVL